MARARRSSYYGYGGGGGGWGEFPAYVSKAERGRDAARATTELKKKGETLEPVRATGTKVAKTFWGRSWCDNLERYSDFANRLPRGRTYLRGGAVIDLRLVGGAIRARVMGSELYEIKIGIARLPPKRLLAIVERCAGEVTSVVDLLGGQLSDELMKIVTDGKTGLFPEPDHLEMDCSCPDGAVLCKHLAAALYGIGVRLDSDPKLLFALRGLDPEELVTKAVKAKVVGAVSGKGKKAGEAAGRVIEADAFGDVFGIDVETEVGTETSVKPRVKKSATVGKRAKKPAAVKKRAKSR